MYPLLSNEYIRFVTALTVTYRGTRCYDKMALFRDDIDTLDKRKLRTSAAWDYFQVKDEGKKVAICNLCNAVLSYKSTISNLTKHLKRKHDFGNLVKTDDEDEDDDGIVRSAGEDNHDMDALDKRKLRKSVAWDYFQVKDEEKRTATCTLCNALFSYKSTVTNLTKHLRRKHDIGNLSKSDDEDVDDENVQSADDEKSTSPLLHGVPTIWDHFNIIDPMSKLASCVRCKKTVSFRSTMSALSRHMARLHPSVQLPENDHKRILVSTGDQLFELETTTKQENDDGQVEHLDLDTVYLDEFVDTNTERKAKKRRISKSKRKRHASPQNSDNSDVERTRNRCHCNREDSLDHFGKYVLSLLRQLPKQLSNKLQMDFVSQIMNAQFTYESERAVKTVPKNGYSITITNETEQDTSGNTQSVEVAEPVPNVMADVTNYEIVAVTEDNQT